MHTAACMLAAAATPIAQDPDHKTNIETLISSLAGNMKKGMDAYRASPHQAERPPQDIIWQSGSTTLERYPQNGAGQGAPILLIPSLINRADILDLDKTISFTRFLAQQGFDVYTLNWHAPSQAEVDFSLNDYIEKRIIPALSHIKGKPHIIGYCMGGTLAAALGAIKPNAIKSLTLLATPWDFQQPDKTLSLRMQAFLMSATPVMATKGELPPDWIQLLFTTIDPLFAFNKFVKFANLDALSDDARRFVIVEDWLNNGVPLTANAATQALNEWYIQNQPASGVWTVGKHLITEDAITTPVCLIASSVDRLVPFESANAFMQQNESVTRITPPLGHIGMMTSSRAKTLVWEPLSAWLNKIDA